LSNKDHFPYSLKDIKEIRLSLRGGIVFSSLKNSYQERSSHLASVKGATIPNLRMLHHSGLRHRHRLLSIVGATMLKQRKKKNFSKVLEWNLGKDEVAFDWFGSHSLL
jgi:hypothetical protein